MTSPNRTPDNSVLFALDELRQLERSRVAEEQAQRDAEAQAAAEAAAAKAAEAQRARQVAEAEARLRVETDLRARDAEAEARIHTLRAELDAVQAERSRMHDRIVALHEIDTPSAPVPGTRTWMAAFGVASLVATGLAVALAIRPPAPVEQVIVEVPVASTAAEPTAELAAPVDEPVVEAPVTEPAAPEMAEPAPATRAQTPRGPRPRQPTRPAETGLEFDGCDTDPILCGI